MVQAIQAGAVWVNCYRRLLYSVPFGGMKASGFGRENGLDVMREYTAPKGVWIDTGEHTRDAFRLA